MTPEIAQYSIIYYLHTDIWKLQ